jgi:ABC-type amino acid transport substrate-binding protein
MKQLQVAEDRQEGRNMAEEAAGNDLVPINIGNINEGAMVQGFEIELAKALAAALPAATLIA